MACLHWKPLRNEAGAIYDFHFMKENDPFNAMLELHEEDMLSKSYLIILPQGKVLCLLFICRRQPNFCRLSK